AVFIFFFIIGSSGEFVGGVGLILISVILGIAVLLLFTNNRLRVLWGTFLLLLNITEFYGVLRHGIEFFPDVQPQRIYINLESPSGTNIAMSDNIVNSIEQKLIELNSKDIKDV